MPTDTPALTERWRSERTPGGIVHRRGVWTALRMDKGDRPWFVMRGFMMLGDKRRSVRRFGSLAAAKKAAEKAMTLTKDQLKPFMV